MIITPKAYNEIKKAHYEDLNIEKQRQKIQVLTTYLDQSEKVLEMVATISLDELRNENKLVRKLAEFDNEIEGFNAQILPKLEDSQKALIELSFDQTKDYAILSKTGFNINNGLIEDIIIQLQRPIPDATFELSTSIWGSDKREAIYKFIVSSSRMSKPPEEIINLLKGYLGKSEAGGGFYKASRVVETEFQRSYVNGLIESTKYYNDNSDDVKLLLKRQLSPLHKINDICDKLVGIYNISESVGGRAGYEVPTHPFCTCMISRIFMDDYDGSIRTMSDYSTIYNAKKK